MTDHALGVPGLSVGALGIMLTIMGGIAAWWVRGLADRRRALNESVTVESKASQAQFDRLEKEIARLTRTVEAQGETIIKCNDRIDKLEHDLIECERRHADAENRLLRLTQANNIVAEGRQLAAQIVAVDRLTQGESE